MTRTLWLLAAGLVGCGGVQPHQTPPPIVCPTPCASGESCVAGQFGPWCMRSCGGESIASALRPGVLTLGSACADPTQLAIIPRDGFVGLRPAGPLPTNEWTTPREFSGPGPAPRPYVLPGAPISKLDAMIAASTHTALRRIAVANSQRLFLVGLDVKDVVELAAPGFAAFVNPDNDDTVWVASAGLGSLEGNGVYEVNAKTNVVRRVLALGTNTPLSLATTGNALVLSAMNDGVARTWLVDQAALGPEASFEHIARIELPMATRFNGHLGIIVVHAEDGIEVWESGGYGLRREAQLTVGQRFHSASPTGYGTVLLRDDLGYWIVKAPE